MLTLEHPCGNCKAIGVIREPEVGVCPECQGEGRILTEDGQAVWALVDRMLSEAAERQSLRADLLSRSRKGV